MNTRHVLSAVAFLSLSGVALSGCNFISNKISEKVSETMVERMSDGQLEFDQSENEYTITTQDGEVKVGTQDISAVRAVVTVPDWMSGSEQGGVMSSESDGKKAVYASLVSERSVTETYDYWVEYMESNGYGDITKADYSGNKLVSGSKNDNSEALAITVSDSPNDEIEGVLVTVVYTGPATE